MENDPADFMVRFSTKVARLLECDDAAGRIEFTVDAGSKGDRSVCLEHHPFVSTRGPRYDLAFRRAKEYLQSCGYEVEIYGE
jgi:hypothetical protein